KSTNQISRAASELLLVFFAAQKFVALYRCHHTHRAFILGFGPLNATEATDAYWSGQCDFVGQGEKNLDGRAFLYIFGKKEVNPARTDIARLRTGLSNRRSRGPSHGEWQPHAKALGGAA